jgi:hypothetical protein
MLAPFSLKISLGNNGSPSYHSGDICLFRIPDPRYDTQSRERKAESAPSRKTGFAEKLPGVPRPQRRVSFLLGAVASAGRVHGIKDQIT